MKRTLYRVAVGLAGTAAVLGLLAAVFWPRLLESHARAKAVEALERKFDVVEIGCFVLGRDHLHICALHLEKETVVVDIPTLDIDFEVFFSEGPVRVDVEKVAAQGGFVSGELEDLRKLRSSEDPAPRKMSRSRVQLEETELELEGFELNVRRHGFQLLTEFGASAPSPAGPVELELEAVELLEDGGHLAGASTLTTSIDLEHIFPLEVHLEGGITRVGELVVEGVAGDVTLEDETLGKVRLELAGKTDVGQSWTLAGLVDREKKLVDVELGADDIRPSQLPGAQDLPLDPRRGLVSGSLHLAGSTKKVAFDGHLRVEELHVVHPRLSRQPVVVNNSLELEGELDLERRVLELATASIWGLEERPAWKIEMSGQAHHPDLERDRQYELEVKLEDAPCQELLEAVPPGLAPALEGFVLEGTTSIDLLVAVDMSDPDATVLEGGLDIDACKLEEVPKSVRSLKGPFSHVVKMRTGRTVSRLLGNGAALYTPLDRIPGSVPAAVLSTEDGGFWRHDGFIKSQFRASLKRNVELGKFRRGASTITMQMVKNVLLTHEKTVSRKLQEMFLTWVVERRLGKERIMELYLNVVEFGPGVYGVTDAADHYFGKYPFELSSLEAAFLATLLPKPVERHEMWCRGELTERHAKYVHRVHRRMLAKGRISQEEFDVAEETPFMFSRLGWPGEDACLAQGRRAAEGTHTQGALSGLTLGGPG